MSLKPIPIPDAPKRPGNAFDQAVKNRLDQPYPVTLPIYTYQELSALTAALYAGKIVRCSNGNAGAECIVYCDGFNWKIIALGGNISLT